MEIVSTTTDFSPPEQPGPTIAARRPHVDSSVQTTKQVSQSYAVDGEATHSVADLVSPAIIGTLTQRGFAYRPSSAFQLNRLSDRGALFDCFERGQEHDPMPGRRWRSHGRIRWLRHERQFTNLPHTAYSQPKAYNPDDGDVQRVFAPIPTSIILGDTITTLAAHNIIIASALFGDVAEAPFVDVGVHMVSYRPEAEQVAFSSPMGLHRDVERLVSVTVFHVSGNLGGGENLLSPGGRSVDSIINMRRSMDTLLLTRKGLHQVLPMYSLDGEEARRDIILVTID